MNQAQRFSNFLGLGLDRKFTGDELIDELDRAVETFTDQIGRMRRTVTGRIYILFRDMSAVVIYRRVDADENAPGLFELIRMTPEDVKEIFMRGTKR